MSNNSKVVYLHKDSNGVVRYIGSGGMSRAYLTCSDSGRGKRYTEFVKANGKLEVEIVAENLSKIEAEDLERELYDKHKETTLNARRPNSINSMSKSMFEEHLYYDETSSSCLRWKIDRVCGKGRVHAKAGSEAGCLDKSNNYCIVGLMGKFYQAHRIICVLHGLEVDGKVVDHVDRDKRNNKISNLRIVTQKENCYNIGMRSDNTSGVRGISYDKQGYWVASWYEEGKQKLKNFSVKNYPSSEAAFNSATEYRKKMVELHYKFGE